MLTSMHVFSGGRSPKLASFIDFVRYDETWTGITAGGGHFQLTIYSRYGPRSWLYMEIFPHEGDGLTGALQHIQYPIILSTCQQPSVSLPTPRAPRLLIPSSLSLRRKRHQRHRDPKSPPLHPHKPIQIHPRGLSSSSFSR